MKHLFYSMKIRIWACVATCAAFLVILLNYYFFTFQEVVNEQVIGSFEQISTDMELQLKEHLQLIENLAKIAGYSTSVQKFLFSDNPSERIGNTRGAMETLSSAVEGNQYITDFYYYIDSHNHIYSSNRYARQFTDHMENYTFSPNGTWNPFYTDTVYIVDEETPYFYYYLPILNSRRITPLDERVSAVGAVLCDMSKLVMLPKSNELDVSAAVYAISYKGRIVSSNRTLDESEREFILQVGTKNSTSSFNGTSYLTHFASMPASGWNFICVLPENSIIGNLISARSSMTLLLVFGTLGIMLLMLYVIRSISSSVNVILSDVNILNRSDSMRIRTPKITELRFLSDKINLMLDRVEKSAELERETREKLYAADIAQQKAELIAYRSQINPHFLFNTMECMRSMAQYYNAEPLEELISSMSNLFHYSLYAENVVPLSRELDHVQSFVSVMSIRFPDKYRLMLNCDESALSFPVPSMVLQPLAENSIKHAFGAKSRQRKNGILCIKANLPEPNWLRILVIDNGRGMTDDEVAEINEKKRLPEEETQSGKESIGIQNIFQRLKLYNPGCHMRFKSKLGHYTAVEIMIPWV